MRKPFGILKKIPESSGVYRFIGKNNKVLYVGRAINLKRRVSQYFQKNIDPRIVEMVLLARDVKITKTNTLFEAIILEANLIKKYLPKYNVREKDNKSFVHLVIPRRVMYPQPFIVRGRELEIGKWRNNGNYVFGPFQGIRELQELLKIIRRVIPLSMGRCVPNSGKPCFDYQIGLCPGVCIGAITRQEYQKSIHNLILLFSGKKQALIKRLQKDNPGQAVALKHIQDVTLISGMEKWKVSIWKQLFNRVEAYDISHFGGKDTYGAMSVMENNRITKDQYRLFKIQSAPGNDDIRALEEMIKRRLRHREWRYPDLMVVDGGIPQVRHIYGVLKLLKTKFPLVGISKLQGDRFVFAPGIDLSVRKNIQAMRTALLGLRDEAHRFGNRARKRGTKNISEHRLVKQFCYTE